MNFQVDPTSSNLACAMLNSKIRPRGVVGYGVKSFRPSPPNYVTRSPGIKQTIVKQWAGVVTFPLASAATTSSALDRYWRAKLGNNAVATITRVFAKTVRRPKCRRAKLRFSNPKQLSITHLQATILVMKASLSQTACTLVEKQRLNKWSSWFKYQFEEDFHKRCLNLV